MSYTALYRKWRPSVFDDVKGQDHIVTVLKNQIAADKVGHAYLFCGTRGTGKTTVAKILAKAVNCEHPVDGSPCGECAVCRAISSGASLDVIEIDAASNNGVDNIRQIREEVQYRPTDGRYKVYIIDEAHMLTVGAWNALLKTIEEPPSYVIFILATTEAHMIPVTILSRCQRYDFKRISVDVITDRLREVVTKENATVSDDALRYIARMADGAFRDALSLLDQCIACSGDATLEYEDVLEVLGTVDNEVFSKMLRLVVNGDVTAIIRLLDEIINQGRDITQFVGDFTWYLRNLLMMQTSKEAAGMMDMSAENLERLREEAFMIDVETSLRYIRVMSELSNSLKRATQKRVTAEVAFIRLTRPQMETDADTLAERIGRLEQLVKEKEDLLALVALRPEVPVGAEPVRPKPDVEKMTIKALSSDIEAVARNWNGIIAQCDNIYEHFLRSVRVTAVDDRLVLVTDNAFVRDFLSKEEHLNAIKEAIAGSIGKTVEVEIRLLTDNVTFEDAFTDVTEYVKMNITIED